VKAPHFFWVTGVSLDHIVPVTCGSARWKRVRIPNGPLVRVAENPATVR